MWDKRDKSVRDGAEAGGKEKKRESWRDEVCEKERETKEGG